MQDAEGRGANPRDGEVPSRNTQGVLAKLASTGPRVGLRVALDALESLVGTGFPAHLPRSATSGARIGHVRFQASGRADLVDPRDGTGGAWLAWELLAGRAAEEGEELGRLHDLLDEVPPDVDDLIARALHEPDSFADPEELFDALVAASDGFAAPHEDVAEALGFAPPPREEPPIRRETSRPAALSAPPVAGPEPAAVAADAAPAPRAAAPTSQVAAQPEAAKPELEAVKSNLDPAMPPSEGGWPELDVAAPPSFPDSAEMDAALAAIVTPTAPPVAPIAPPVEPTAPVAPLAPTPGDAPDRALAQTILAAGVATRPASGAPPRTVPQPAPSKPFQPSATLVLIVASKGAGDELASAIRAAGHDVAQCSDAVAGLALAKELSPACIVCDFDLQDESGDQLAHAIRRDDGPLSLTPLMLLARPADTRARVARYAVGADVCILKPYKLPDVVAQATALVRFATRLRSTRAVIPAVEKPARTELSGTLDRVPLRALLTILEMERHSGQLEVVSSEHVARLDVLTGRLLPTALADGRRIGVGDVLADLSAWSTGRFVFKMTPHAAPPAEALVISDALAALEPRVPTSPTAARGLAPSLPPASSLPRPRGFSAPPPTTQAPESPSGSPSWSTASHREGSAHWAVTSSMNFMPVKPMSSGVMPASIVDASPVDLADLILLAWLSAGMALLAIEPAANGGYAVSFGGEPVPAPFNELPSALGEATVARIVLLAGMDIGHPEEQLGRLRVSDAATELDTELMVIARSTRSGMAVEVKRVAGARDSQSRISAYPTAQGQATPVVGAESQYKVIRELGQGAAGAVYLVEHVTLGKRAALKVLHPQIAAIPEVSARFVREGRAAARVRHPGVIDVFDYGVMRDGRAFLVMEYVEGPTLEQIIDNEPPMDPARAVNIARQIASVLDAVHAAGVIHRDVKPSNVLLAPGDLVKLGDFGVAKVPDPDNKMTHSGALIGTPTYMAPEHMSGEPLDHRTDLYALGCVIYEMLTGRVAYTADSVVAILVLHVTAPIPEIKSPHGPLPRVLEATVRRAMAKRPKDRYDSARALIMDLDRAAAALQQSQARRTS